MPTIPTKGQGLQTSLEQVRRQLVAQRARLVDANARSNDRQRTAITARIAQIDVWLADLNKRIGARAWGKLRTTPDTMGGIRFGVLVGDRSRDETMGDLNVGGSVVGQVSAGRNLDLVGSMGKGSGFEGYISLVSLADNYIKPTFINGGWKITGGIDLTWNGSRYLFRIPVWVRNQYSDTEVRNGARSTLLSVRHGALRLQTFSDVQVTLESQNVVVNPNTGQNLPQTNPPSSWDPFAGLKLPAGLDAALNPVAIAMGVSAGTILIGGGLVLVLLLRRR